MAGLQIGSITVSHVHWVPAPDITSRKIKSIGLELVQLNLSTHIGGLWSTFHPTDTCYISDRCVVLGLQSLTKLKS